VLDASHNNIGAFFSFLRDRCVSTIQLSCPIFEQNEHFSPLKFLFGRQYSFLKNLLSNHRETMW
jgi:hypothetical protein